MADNLILLPLAVMVLGIIGYFVFRAEGRRLDRDEERAKQERLTPR